MNGISEHMSAEELTNAVFAVVNGYKANHKGDDIAWAGELLFSDIKIVKNTPKRATTVFWGDGSVTTVKSSANEEMDDYSAFTAALAKRMLGNNTKVKKIVRQTHELRKKGKKK